MLLYSEGITLCVREYLISKYLKEDTRKLRIQVWFGTYTVTVRSLRQLFVLEEEEEKIVKHVVCEDVGRG